MSTKKFIVRAVSVRTGMHRGVANEPLRDVIGGVAATNIEAVKAKGASLRKQSVAAQFM